MDVHELVPREIAGMSYINSRFFSVSWIRCGEKMRRVVYRMVERGRWGCKVASSIRRLE